MLILHFGPKRKVVHVQKEGDVADASGRGSQHAGAEATGTQLLSFQSSGEGV